MSSVDIPAQFRNLVWQRLRIDLINTRTSPVMKLPVIAVLEAIVKSITSQTATHNSPSAPPPIVFFHVPDKRFSFKVRPGSRIALHLFFFRLSAEQVVRWAETCRAYFEEQESPRNYRLLRVQDPEERRMEDIFAAMPPLKQAGEIALDFLTPLPFHPRKPTNRIFLNTDQFIHLFLNRFSRLFGKKFTYQPGEDDFRILPYYWKYTQMKRPSHSQPGTTQYIKGCFGPLYIKGNFKNFFPFLILGSELHTGGKMANAQGYYRLLIDAPAYFSRFFPDKKALFSVIDDVLSQHDEPPDTPRAVEKQIYRETDYAEQLYADLVKNEYLPQPNIAFRIPKKDKTTRVVEQLPIRDLIVHQYLFRTIRKVFDRFFEEGSIGYRKGIARQKAVELVRQAIREGYQYVIESDIEDFFPSVNLHLLTDLLNFYIPEKDVLLKELIFKCLYNGYILGGKYYERKAGLAQGSPLSPLLANLFLDAFDEKTEEWGVRIIRYADDFIILTRSKEEAERILMQSESYLADELGVKINRSKTAIRPLSEGFRFLGIRFEKWEVKVEPEENLKRLRKPLYITERYVFLALNGEALNIYKNKKLIETIPLRRLSEIIVMDRVSFSTALLRYCTEKNIPITVTLGSGYFITTIKPDSKRYYEINAAHSGKFYQLTETERLAIAREIAALKLKNYLPLFRQRYTPGMNDILKEIEMLAERIFEAADIHQVRGYEGAGTRKIYQWLNSFINHPAFKIRKRQRRKPDRINSLLNFGYYLLFSRLNTTIRSLGLNPYLGFLHSPEDNYESLVSDMVELFRARIDRFILKIVNLKTITAQDFVETPRGMYLTREAAHKFLLQFEREMDIVPKNERLSLKEQLYYQALILRKWALEDGSLIFYRWGDAK